MPAHRDGGAGTGAGIRNPSQQRTHPLVAAQAQGLTRLQTMT
jgi:hypothetical protein